MIILSLVNNGMVESAKEAKFKQDIKVIRTEFDLSLSKLLNENTSFDVSTLVAGGTGNIYCLIPSAKGIYEGEFEVKQGNLKYKGNDLKK